MHILILKIYIFSFSETFRNRSASTSSTESFSEKFPDTEAPAKSAEWMPLSQSEEKQVNFSNFKMMLQLDFNSIAHLLKFDLSGKEMNKFQEFLISLKLSFVQYITWFYC